MANIKWDTEEFNKKMEEITRNIIHNVEGSSDEIVANVFWENMDVIPLWKGTLMSSIYKESIPFRQITETKLRQELIYDAWNPKTGFHYAFLRHEQTTTGKKYWFRDTLKWNSYLLIEKPLTQAVKRSVR